MRTKTLLLTAAVVTASLATSMAQSTNVYSANIVGYVNYINAPGYRLIANPLNSTNNTVANIFASPPDYLSVFKRDATGTGFISSQYDPDIPGWSNPSLALAPGEGAFIYNPLGGNYTNTYVGEVVLDSTNNIAAGYQIRGSVVPQAGGLETTLLYPVASTNGNTIVYRYNGSSYTTYTYDIDGPNWSSPNFEPSINVGEGFWINNGAGAKQWIRHFSVGP